MAAVVSAPGPRSAGLPHADPAARAGHRASRSLRAADRARPGSIRRRLARPSHCAAQWRSARLHAPHPLQPVPPLPRPGRASR